SKRGKRMLVWNGEHYNLGNVLGMKPNQATNYMQETYLGAGKIADGPIQTLHRNLTQYLNSCEDQGYKYNFLICSVSGVFSDNAPPSLEILNTIEEYNKVYGRSEERRVGKECRCGGRATQGRTNGWNQCSSEGW